MGCWAIGGTIIDQEGKPTGYGIIDDKESIKAIQCAIDLGINFFDTADMYGAGHSEEILGKAIQGYRDDIVIATKFGNTFDSENKRKIGTNITPKYIKMACEASLNRLGTDFIDLYQLHIWHVPKEELIPIIETLDDLQENGQIKAYGWSTDLSDLSKYFVENSNCVSIQHELNVLHDMKEIIDLCETNNLASINRTVLAMGLLTGKYSLNSILPDNDVRGKNAPEWLKYFKKGKPDPEWLGKLDSIKDILMSDGRSMVQGALSWILARSDKTIPIPGFKTKTQVEENVKTLEFGSLNNDQMKKIDEILGERNFTYTTNE
ncbi:MAG: aldo/keto reductase [Candidatus Lokiarchaeota archaeon]|nr:aldo/keto reductase [Candidatus Lokiarchaeota archaeon]